MEFSTYVWLLLGGTMTLAYFAQRYIAEKFNIPSVAIFMVLGVLLGTSGTDLYTKAIYAHLGFISDIVLGIISFMIGAELSPKILKQLGKPIIFIALGEVILASIFVSWATMHFANLPFYTALMLGAVASATAPAATVYVIKTYKSKGPVTSTILGVVGIDDAFSLILFSIVSIVVQSLLSGASSIPFMPVLTGALTEIGLATLFGILGGLIFYFIVRKLDKEEPLFIVVMSFILFFTGVSKYFEISQLLLLMVFGITCVSLSEKLTHKTKIQLDQTYVFLVPIFFILAGSTFDWKYAMATLNVGLVYTIARALGKYMGAFAGARFSRLPTKTSSLVGLGLFPQVGVAFGLIIVLQQIFGSGQFGNKGSEMVLTISNVLIWTTFLTETIGPLLTKLALQKCGEIGKSHSKKDMTFLEERKLTK